ncbi:MAG: hypothetical protein NDJ92_13800 [Thermoanaerobaculia bacterium]|nr:hypothetical protein [Thermoanaerobaculia bacterium]
MRESNDDDPVRDQSLDGDPFAEESPYEVLGLDRDADLAKVTASLRAVQKRAERGSEDWLRAQAAAEILSDPRRRLAVDLFTIHETRLHEEIVRRYRNVQFELVPDDIVTPMMQASDLAWGDPVGDFTRPAFPRVIFENMLPAPAREDELVVPDRKK